jgi:hypothetical protein
LANDDLRSPRLDALLARLGRALVRGVLLHGVGTVVAAGAGWLLFAALADYLLHLPAPIRIAHGLLAIGVPLFLLRRCLLTPLGRVPGREGLALLLERTRPDGQTLLISAVQLPGQVGDSPARELVAQVVARAEEQAATLDPGPVLDHRGPRLRALAGMIALGAALALGLARPGLASIFFERMLGGGTRWPQRTHLTVEVPAVSDRIQVELVEGEIRVRAARGSDLPVLVHAEGVIPSEVLLHFDNGHTTAISSGGSRLFRASLNSVQEDVTFHVTGGDDEGGRPLVRVTVLQPPDVAGLAWSVVPPAYSGQAPFVAHAPDVEVLQGSEVTVHLLPDPPEATGVAHLYPEDRELSLEPRPFPQAAEAEGSGLASPDRVPAGLAFDLTADLSMRISFELSDDTGLPNPDPGLYALSVVEDRRPEVLVLAPGRADVEVVLGGALPLRLRVEDDFGLARLAWDVRSDLQPDEPMSSGELASATLDDPAANFAGGRIIEAASTLLEVDRLGGQTALEEGMQLTLQVYADDNREPQANQTPSAPVRVRVVSGDEYLRQLQDQLARASETAQRVHKLAAEKEQTTRDLLSASSGEEPDEALGDIAPLLHGARRVQGDARALGRDLAHVAEGLLYSRLDPRGSALLGALDTGLSQNFDRSFHPDPWRDVAARYRAGQLGQADLAGTLVEIVGLALDASELHLGGAADALRAAAEATDPSTAREALARAVQSQARARDTLDELLVKLGEWDNFQSVLTLTRDILNRQKNLIQRTKKLAEDK